MPKDQNDIETGKKTKNWKVIICTYCLRIAYYVKKKFKTLSLIYWLIIFKYIVKFIFIKYMNNINYILKYLQVNLKMKLIKKTIIRFQTAKRMKNFRKRMKNNKSKLNIILNIYSLYVIFNHILEVFQININFPLILYQRSINSLLN